MNAQTERQSRGTHLPQRIEQRDSSQVEGRAVLKPLCYDE